MGIEMLMTSRQTFGSSRYPNRGLPPDTLSTLHRDAHAGAIPLGGSSDTHLITTRIRAPARTIRMWHMHDIFWIAAMLGLLALTIAYVRLCDHA
jgi:hypothetical protein